MEKVTAAAIALGALSCGCTLMAFPDCTLCSKTSAQKAARAQRFRPASSSSFSISVAFQDI